MQLSSLWRRLAIWIVVAIPLVTCALWGQTRAHKRAEEYDKAARATVIHDANVYVAADADAQKISLVTPGHEVVAMERSGPWVKVFANTDVADDANEDDSNKPEFGEDANVTPASGWIRDKGVVGPTTAGGDVILFGSAANMEDEAEQPNAPKGAAAGAHLLYRRVTEYFPDSSLAPEAAWRSADVRWQLDKRDISTLPSAKEQEAYLRPQIYEGELRKVMKNYPGTQFAARAAYELLDNKLCGDWQGLPKCPEMEAGLYEKYAQQFPDGPKAAEALYNAVYRQGVVVTMYTVQEDRKHAQAAAQKTQALAEELKDHYPKSDFAARGTSIAFRVSQGIAIYGTDRD
jgi:outer membrane protein assembly factor BamD (BamD/ComL family)